MSLFENTTDVCQQCKPHTSFVEETSDTSRAACCISKDPCTLLDISRNTPDLLKKKKVESKSVVRARSRL